ncbi:MAG: hypothetical protein ACR2LR_01330, partial [Hassallia sp.]
MTKVAIVSNWEQQIQDNITRNFCQDSLPLLYQKFKREGLIKVPEIMPLNIRQEMKQEALR